MEAVPLKHLRPTPNKVLVRTLAQLLQEAQSGELQDFAYTARNIRTGSSADAIGQPDSCISLAQALLAELLRLAGS